MFGEGGFRRQAGVVRENGILSSKLAFKDGVFTVMASLQSRRPAPQVRYAR